MRVRLINGDMVLELDPQAGGAVSALRHGDLEIFRPAPPRSGPAFDPLAYAAFPMVPFVGRIFEGRAKWQDHCLTLPANLPPEPHAIHGHGWRAAWSVADRDDTRISLSYTHDDDAWPWHYTAKQIYDLKSDGLVVDLSVKNEGDTPMPAGLGWHPYFYRAGAVLKTPTTREWHPNDETGDSLPLKIAEEADLSQGLPVEGLNLDTTYSLAKPIYEMQWPTHRVTMTADPVFAFATIYVPPGQDYFCAEPISHAPFAINSSAPMAETGLRSLAIGETLSGSITLRAER
ncbi:MAG: aldose 1-epimerase [Pseudomonadota bacterium]